MDFVGFCSVCEEEVDESDAGYCVYCGEAFHWSSCGGWEDTDRGKQHVCGECKKAELKET
jgi:hypothetical protein